MHDQKHHSQIGEKWLPQPVGQWLGMIGNIINIIDFTRLGSECLVDWEDNRVISSSFYYFVLAASAGK
jgi:hypothetical protein